MPEKTLICIRRGTEAELVNVTLEVGELGFTTDTHKLFIGSDMGNLFLARGTMMKHMNTVGRGRYSIGAGNIT